MPIDETHHASRLAFAADLGGTNLRAALIDGQGQIHFRLKQATPRTGDHDEVVQALLAAAHECENYARRSQNRVATGCVVVPGTIDSLNETVIQAPNIRALDQLPLRSVLQERLGWEVLLENDANAAAIGEMWLGAGRGFKTIACLTLGTGVGGGLILDGKLWRGPDGTAGEFGHAAVDPLGGVPCKCGNEGCLEMYASGTAIKRMTNEARARFPQSPLFAREDLTARDVYDSGVAGDRLALEVFERVGTYLGIALASLVNVLNPELIIIGGGVANGWRLFEKQMRKELSKRAFPVPAARVKIVAAECGDDAGLLGAARLAFESARIDSFSG
ncbi:MAG: ROK family protein [Acidobacteriota bacterium]|nr:ROK family protein [Acidobacteriota bacterium]